MKQKQHKPEKNEDNKSSLAREEQTSNDNLSPLEETLEAKADESVPAEKDCAENNTSETAENPADANEKDSPSDNEEKIRGEALVIENSESGNPFGMEVKKETKKREKLGFWKTTLKVLNYIFIDGLSGMAIGLFATLIIGTIIGQIGSFIPGVIGKFIGYIGTFAKAMMGAGIGIGMAYKLKKAPMVSISAGVAGMIGAFASNIIDGNTVISGVGEPLGAFIAAFVALETGSLVAGKTKVDIIVTPLVSIFSGAVIGLLAGPPISSFMNFIGSLINASAQQQPVIMGILVSVLMGIALTLPISSAAIGVALSLSGIAAGAAVVGCCCQMVGFAVMSFRENRWSGLVAQGIGTSMLQMPNIIRRPVIWLPTIIASAILGPISTAVFGMVSTPVGSGMGTAGLVGPFQTYVAMTEAGFGIGITLTEILFMHIILPAALVLGISELMRYFKVIRKDDLKLDL